MLALRRLLKLDKTDPLAGVSPMEALSTEEISPLLYSKFEVLEDVHFNAFVTQPLISLSGPDTLRYGVARVLIGLDRLLCQAGVCRGFYRIIIARKTVHG